MRRYLRATCRFASLLAYAVSLLIFYYVQPIAAKAYIDLCATQGTTFGSGESVRTLSIAMVIVAVPLLFALSDTLLVINLIISLITALGAGGLLSTAANIPYACFTNAGTYEDHTSGLEGFGFWFAFVILFTYILLLIDLVIWAARKAAAFWATSQSR